MVKRNIFIIMFILCIILSIQAVSSTNIDLNNTDDLTIQDNDIISISNINETLNENEASFSQLSVDLSEGGSITLTKNYTYIDSDSGTDGITIAKDTTINGYGVIIDAKFKSRIFNINTNSNVVINGVTFVNGNATGSGGAIYSEGKLTLNDCTFKNNIAHGDGGAVYLQGAGSIVNKSYFEKNRAISTTTTNGFGGGVSLSNENCSILASIFINNTAGINGGGAVVKSANSNSLGTNATLRDSIFKYNNATRNGGAICWNSGCVNGSIYNTTFEHNVAYGSAGAVGWQSNNGEIYNSTFKHNRAFGITEGFPGNGGGLTFTGSNGYVYNCTFINNTAKTNGGGAYLKSNPGSINNNTWFIRCTFINNTANVNGGGVDWSEGATNGNIINSTFMNNTALGSGGAVYWNGHSGTINYSNFTYNKAKGNVNDTYGNCGDGGSIIWSGMNGNVTNCIFINNNASKRGGAVYLRNNAEGNCDNTTFKNSKFINNTAGTNGGAIDWSKGAHNGLVDNCIFERNVAKRSGGGIYWNGKMGKITNSNFTLNRALGIANATDAFNNISYGGDGGAVIWIGSDGMVDNSRFIQNKASKRGGAVYLQGTIDENCTDTNFTNSHFENNTAGTNGGALDWNKGAHDGLVDNCNFTNNTAKRSGGAIFWFGENGTVKNSNFINNRATGEYLLYNMDLTFENVLIINSQTLPSTGDANKLYVLNYTSDNGRIFKSYVYDDGWILLDEIEIDILTISPKDWAIDQFFGGDGGTILWNGNIGLVYNCNFTQSNSARRGGGAYMTGSDNVTYNHCNFINCTSGTNGGGVDWLAGANYGKIYNCVFNNTRAARSAGAIYYDGWYGHIENITVINTRSWGGSINQSDDGIVKYAGWDSSHWDTNTTGGDAGCIMFTGNHEYIFNATFINCTAQGRGGAVFLQDNTNVTFELCKFYNNCALGIANNTYNDDRNQNSGKNIWLTGNGGAIGFDIGATFGVIKNSTFINNTARRLGGAISFAKSSSNCSIMGSTFNNNVANRSGGAISWDGNNGNMLYCSFDNNMATGVDINRTVVNVTSLNQILNVTTTNPIVNESALPAAGTGTINKLYVVIKYNSTKKESYSLYVTNKFGDKYVWVYLGQTTVTEPSYIDWAVDECLGGDGGSIFWRGDNGNVNHCEFVNSTSARRGGGAYMVGSDNISFINSKFINCTSGTNGGGLDWLAGANYGKVINCTFNNTKAARTAGAIYYDGDFGEIRNILVINTFAYGGTLESPSYIDYEEWDVSHWDTNTTGGDAGAVAFTGNHEYIFNATFINCTAQGRGGAVFLQDNVNITFDSCKFIGNEALGIANNTWNDTKVEYDGNGYNYKLTGHGGAIAFDIGAQNCTITNSEFIYNYARRDGGAINFAKGTFNGTIINTKFTNNSCGDDGGAMNWEGNVGNIKNVTAYNNTGKAFADPVTGNSTSKGGTICLTGNNITITESNFKLSTVSYNKGKLNETDAGAIFLTGNYTTISHTTFDTCYAPYNAGAIEVIGDNTTIINCTFKNCNSTKDGGALYISGKNCEIYNSTLINNLAGDDGGAIYWKGNLGKVYNITCFNNRGISLGNSSSNGGTLSIIGSNITISKSNFTKTYALIAGGAIFITGDNVTIQESSFKNCNVSNDADNTNKEYANGGGSIYVFGSYSNILNCTFDTSNGREGGAIYVEGNNAIIYGSNFTNTESKNYGGAIYISGKKVSVSNSNFNISATLIYGGAIYIKGQNATVNGSNFIKSTVTATTSRGGAIYVEGKYANLLNSKFSQCTSKTDAGGVYISGDFTEVKNSTFVSCQSTNAGGLFIKGGNATVVDSNFTNNFVTGDGGAIYSDGKGSKVYNSTFVNNYNTKGINAGNGGAIYWKGGSNEDLIECCNFNSNKASYAGAIYMAANTAADTAGTIRKCNFTYNEGTRSGAVGWASSNKALIEYCYFGHNIASKHGAGIYAGAGTSSGKEFRIYNCSFEDNVVDGGVGGAISVRISNTEIISCNFTDNKASAGGSIIIKESGVSNVRVDDCYFENSQSISGGSETGSGGGAIAIWGVDAWSPSSKTNNITVTNSMFINCSAKEYSGGAIDWSSPNGLLENCTFINCSADYGGSIGYETYNTKVNNITIINPTSTNYGAGIYIGEVTLRGSNAKTTLYAYNSILTNIKINGANVSDGNGGAIYIDEVSRNIKLSNFSINNSYALNGGAVFILGSAVEISESNFTNNTALYGGAIYNNVSSFSEPVVLSNNLFITNGAVYDGGAVYSNSYGSTISYCNFTNNTAGRNGAAIAITIYNQNINNCNFYGNNATENGGSIYVGVVTQITIRDSTFEKSYAKSGGAIYNAGNIGSSVYITNDTFKNNIATHNGGAILYIVEALSQNPVYYRDYMKFDGRGNVDSETGRTTIDSLIGNNGIYPNRIVDCLFEDNIDYVLSITSASDLNTTTGIIYIHNPRDPDKSSLKIVINLTKADGSEGTTQLVIDETNMDNYYNSLTHQFAVYFDYLEPDAKYNATVVYQDDFYLAKSNLTSFQVANVGRLGQFQILQILINNAYSKDGDNAVLNLTRSYVFTEGLDNSSVYLNHTIKINGNGWTINSLGHCRIFIVNADDVTLNRLVLVNGNASGDNKTDDINKGGAIYWSGANGQLINSTVRNNVAEYGGGIFYTSTAVNCKINGCEFEQNNASERGGAIDCNATKMNLTNTEFNNNYANYGAGLCRETEATGGLGYNNTFKSNYAKTAGAALAWMNSTHIVIDKYTFENNVAGYSGGAIFVGFGSGNCEIYNSNFTNNNVLNLTNGHGGAIEWYAETGVVSNSNFTLNTAYRGGALYVGSQSGKINISNSNFYENFATSEGGAVCIDASSVTVNASNFYNNTALDGGAMYVGGEGFTNKVISSIYKGNKASDRQNHDGRGGAIDWVASSGYLIDTNFTENYADYGGAVYMGGNSISSQINNCLFESNYARYNGGAIDWNSTGGQLIYTTFISNYGQFGAALCRESGAGAGFGYNNTFISNHAYVAGAALGWMGSVRINITNYTFINNSADVSGGAIYVSSDSPNCVIINCNFEGNFITNVTYVTSDIEWTSWDGDTMYYYSRETTDESLIGKVIMDETSTTYYYSIETGNPIDVGGAINILASNATLKFSNFTNNSARLGGAVYVSTTEGYTNIIYSNFDKNSAHEFGGAVNIHASGVSVNNSKFNSNNAIDGGAMFVSGAGLTNYVINSIFANNTANQGHGGAIEWIASQGHIEFTNFTNNTASYGGGIFFNGESHNSSIINVRFENNNATFNGGAIDWDASYGKLYNTTFISNYAGEYGAALCRESGATKGSGNNNTFISNHAGMSGAALAWIDVSNIKIENYHFINNTAAYSGGAILVNENSDNCIIFDCIFDGNYLTNTSEHHNGGAIDCRASNATINLSIFKNNIAYDGGAIYFGSGSGNSKMINSNFTDNYAYGNGGAVGLKGSAVNITNTRYYNNTAVFHGGAVYVGGTGTTNVIYYSEFTDNTAGDHGGAINWVASAGDIILSNFTRNSAIYGGAIYLNGISSNSRIANVIFNSNSASKNGGAIDCNASMMGLNNTQFISNYAGEYGAALCREANATGGYGGNNSFIKNHADISGAALAWLGVDGITIRNYNFINNTADVSGGAIYVRGDSPNCNIYDSYFDYNHVTDVVLGQGGSVDWLGANGYIFNTTFNNSFAVNGGAIFAGLQSNNITINQSIFTSSRGLGEGGTIIIYSDNAYIINSNFSYSIALEKGGVISAHNATNATINNCIFEFNVGAGYVDPSKSAYGDGGAIFWQNANNLNISNSIFRDLESHADGGAISIINCNNSLLYNLTFKGELSIRRGGSLSWINSTNVTIDTCSFADSASSYAGGAIYLDTVNNATVKNSKFNNTSSPWGNGGAIYVNGNVTIDNSTFEGYDAVDDYDGGVFLYGGNSTILNSTFIGPDAIWINKTATAYLYENNITGSRPNKNITHLDKAYDAKYNKYDYSVWNDGIMYLDKNNFDYIIFNNGTIMTNTTTYILDNKTWNKTWNTDFSFWANITDDNHNTIISVATLDTYNLQISDERYLMPYNNIDLILIYQGSFVIYGNDTGLKNNKICPGTINVQMPVTLELNYSDITYETITITASLKTPAMSNFTIQNQKIHFYLNDVLIEGNIINGVAKWNVATSNFTKNHLPVGTYKITATYDGDDYHIATYNETTFSIYSHIIWIKVHANDIFFGQNLLINVTSNAVNTVNGRIIISINGRDVSLHLRLDDDGNCTYELPEEYYSYLVAGENVVSVRFYNGTYYDHQFNSSTFNVFKLNTTIDVIPTNISFGENEIINVTVNKNATGYISLYINNQIYTAIINNGTAQFNITGLNMGKYENITVKYNPNNTLFNQNSTNITFTVNATEDYDIIVDVEDIKFGENVTIKVILPTGTIGNVTIYIDGLNKGTIDLINNIAKLENISGLIAGLHEVNVTFNGGSIYAPKDKNGTHFSVTPTDNWKINITVSANNYGKNTTFYVLLPNDTLLENIILIIENVQYIVNLTGGKGNLTLNNISAGMHDVVANYTGDIKYSGKINSTQFYINKSTPQISLIRLENGDIVASVSDNATGNVTFYVNMVPLTINLTNGNATLLKGNLSIGNNDVIAIYNSDGNHTTAIAIRNFEVAKYNAVIDKIVVPVVNVTVGSDVTVDVVMGNVTGGFVVVELGGHNYTVDINGSGVARLVVKLPVGRYNVTAYYMGSDEYNPKTLSNGTDFFVVGQTVSVLNVTVDHSVVVVDNNVTINVTTNSNASVVVKVNNVVVPVSADGLFRFNATVAGNYTVIAEVYDNGWFTSVFNSTTFNVIKHNSTVSIDPIVNHVVGDSFIITIHNSTDVNVTINGKEYKLNGTSVIINTTILSAGEYVVSAFVKESDKCYSNSSTISFNITKHSNNINIGVNKKYYVGESFNITVTSDCDVNVTINGKVYPVVNGNVSISHDNLTAGHYIITAVNSEDNKYLFNISTKEFDIVKYNSTVNLTVNPIFVGDVALINISVPDDIDATVKINVNGTNYTFDVSGGSGSLEIKDLKSGSYTINVTYLENTKYLTSSNTSDLVVSKLNTTIEVKLTNITYGKAVIINVTVDSDAHGNISVKIGDKNYDMAVLNGKANFVILDIADNVYDVEIKFNGDDKFNANSITARLNVSSADELSIKVIDNKNGTITVILPQNAIGNVSINIGGNDYIANVLNGTALVDISNATPGTYEVEVKYISGGDYNNKTVNATVTRPKYTTNISIEVNESYVGDNIKIIVSTPDKIKNNVTIEINGVSYSAKSENGQATFEIDTLQAGNKTIVAIYDGDDWFEDNITTKHFTVFKHSTSVSVNVIAINSNNVTINVTLPDEATGFVILNINGTEYAINLTKGNTITVPVYQSGKYTVDATYLGDNKYLANSNETSFEINVQSGNVSIEINNITVGDKVVVDVNVPDDAQGNITVIIDGEKYVVPVTGGENIITLPGISEGIHTINVTYSGDSKYDSKTIVQTITVVSSINTPESYTRAWNSPYDYEAEFLDENGQVLENTDVQFTVNGKTYAARTDEKGIARLTNSHLPIGQYDVTAINPVTGQSITKHLSIVNRIVENKDLSMDFKDGSRYTVRVIGDDGNPANSGEFVAITVNGKVYAAKTNENGYASLLINLNPKTYTITAEYKNTKISNKLIVKQTLKLTKKTIKVKKYKKSFKLKATLKFTNGKAIKGAEIVFKFKGKTYKAKTNSKGLAKVTIKKKIIKKLKKGKKYQYSAKYITNSVKGKVKVK